MVLSSSERDDLVLRVERALARTPGPVHAPAALVRDAVDRTLGALRERAGAHVPGTVHPPGTARPDSALREGAAAILAAPVPDLASRVREALQAAGVSPSRVATAREGRHTVVTLAVRATDEAAVRQVAQALGASCAWRGGVT